MSSVLNEITKAMNSRMRSSGVCTGTGCPCVNCMRYSSLVGRVGVFESIYEGPIYSNYSNVPKSQDCFGNTLVYSTVSARHGMFSNILITPNYMDYTTSVITSNVDGAPVIYDTYVAQTAYFNQTEVTVHYANHSTVCAVVESNAPCGGCGSGCGSGPTGPIGPTGPPGIGFSNTVTFSTINTSTLSVANAIPLTTPPPAPWKQLYYNPTTGAFGYTV